MRRCFFVFFCRCRFHNRTDCFCNSSLFSNDLAHIGSSNMKFDRYILSFFFFCYYHFVRIVNKSFSDYFH